MYRLFLYITSQLVLHEKVDAFFEGEQLHFSYLKNEKAWLLSVKVASFLEVNVEEVKECFAKQKQAKFFSSDSFLELELSSDSAIHLKRKIYQLHSYRLFSCLLKEYLKEKNEWKALFVSSKKASSFACSEL